MTEFGKDPHIQIPQYLEFLKWLNCKTILKCTSNIHCLRRGGFSAVADCAAEGPDVVFNITTSYSQEIVVSGIHTIHQTLS